MNEQELLDANARYRSALAEAKVIANAERAIRIEELTKDALIELSKTVHSAHAEGMTKATINAILGVYSNASQAKPIWGAFSPAKQTDLRVRRGDSTPDVSIPDATVSRSGSDILVDLQDDHPIYIVGAHLFREGEDSWAVWDIPDPTSLGDDYSAVYQAVYHFLVDEQSERE